MNKGIVLALLVFLSIGLASFALGGDKLVSIQKDPVAKAYVISEVEILDENAANHYKQFAAASIAAYGGRYLVRGAEPEVAEGQVTSRRIIIAEFPSMDILHKWYKSPEYAKALQFRKTALDRRLMFVEGMKIINR